MLALLLAACGGSGSGAAACNNAGTACTPAGACRAGQIACTANGPVCQDVGVAADGSTAGCGSGLACFSGQCAAAVATAPLTIYWTFERHAQSVLGGIKPYDTQPTAPPVGTPGSCTESGADTVSIGIRNLATGQQVQLANSTFDCVSATAQGSVQGVTIDLPVGSYGVTLRGSLLTPAVDLYQTPLEVPEDLVAGGTTDTIPIPGIQDDLDMAISFGSSTCAASLVTTATYFLFDSNGTQVASGNFACPLANPAAVSVLVGPAHVDREFYQLRVEGFVAGTTPTFDSGATANSCQGVPLSLHDGPNTFTAGNNFTQDVPLSSLQCPTL